LSAASPVLVTGANGFIGSALVSRLAREGTTVRAAVRQPSSDLPAGVQAVAGVALEPGADWTAALASCAVVVHAAARAHQMDREARNVEAYQRVNADATAHLARQAAAAGVRRFVFISSIKVNGERSLPGRPFTEYDPPAPRDAYGVSKLAAENALREVGAETGMETVVVRPVLTYGPGVRANFLAMLRWIWRGIPLPFGAVRNLRSLVGVDNLTDFLATCVRHGAASNQTFLVSDGRDLSTPELIRSAGAALQRPARLFAVPPRLLGMAGFLAGKQEPLRRLLDSLQVDIAKARRVLGWDPPQTFEAELERTARWFLSRRETLG
jgi:nucleoside-diphosphate-sugar epimerase